DMSAARSARHAAADNERCRARRDLSGVCGRGGDPPRRFLGLGAMKSSQVSDDFPLKLYIGGQWRDAEAGDTLVTFDPATGKPLCEAKGDVETTARYFEYYAGIADKLQGDTIPLGMEFLSFTLHEPVGVTAHIIPWNFPLVTTARGLAPALAAGNVAIVKPAEQTPLTALLLPEYLAEAGLPAGVVNIVCGTGQTTGAPLTAHPDVAHVTFTGSVATGKAVMQSAATHVASVT